MKVYQRKKKVSAGHVQSREYVFTCTYFKRNTCDIQVERFEGTRSVLARYRNGCCILGARIFLFTDVGV